MLEAVGVAPTDEEIYRALLLGPRCTVAQLASVVGIGEPDVRRSVERLEDLGLVSRVDGLPDLWVPARPDVAVDVLAASRRVELDRAQMEARVLLAEMRTAEQHRPENLVEVIVGQQMIAGRFAQLLSDTTRGLRVLDRPPYASAPGESEPTVRKLLSAGVDVRGIYSSDSFERPGAVESAYSAADAGEVARVHPNVPMKLAVFDSAAALLPLSTDQLVDSALVVHPCALLDALVQMFELLWQQALPVVGQCADMRAGSSDARLMTLLASGLKDDAIARQLDLSSRTVGRRVAELMDGLGSRTRFQAGIHAQRRGLVGDS